MDHFILNCISIGNNFFFWELEKNSMLFPVQSIYWALQIAKAHDALLPGQRWAKIVEDPQLLG